MMQEHSPDIESPSREEDDASLVASLQAFDQAAWATLYDQHQARLWRYAYGRTGDRDVADDIVAQVFVEALESIPRFRYTGKPILAWLYRIARNHLGKRFRDAKRQFPLSRAEQAAAPPDAALGTIALFKAVNRLTFSQQEIIRLRFFAGYTTREIAGVLGKSETAIYSAEVRAMAALRRHLDTSEEKISSVPDENRGVPGINRVR